MSKFILLLFIVQVSLLASGQNLVPNSSFETYLNCPSSSVGFEPFQATEWQSPVNHTGTADYFHVCATNALVQVPMNILGSQNTVTGQGYVGLYSWRNFAYVREYLEIQLTSPMIAGGTYSVSAYFSLGDRCEFAVDGLGFYLSDSAYTNAPGVGIIPVTPHYLHSQPLQEKDQWVELAFDYIATGGEQWLLIGNFLDENMINVIDLGTFDRQEAYYYMDDVSVEYNPPQISVTPDTTICEGSAVQLTAFHDDPFWWSELSNPGVSVGNSSSITVAPNSTTTYVVHGNTLTDTVTVNVEPTISINLGADTLLCPNETLVLNNPYPNASPTWSDGSTKDSLQVSVPGSYSLTIQGIACSASDQINVDIATLVSFPEDTTLCLERTIMLLNAYPFQQTQKSEFPGTYLWNNGETSPTHLVSESGIYTVQVNNRCGEYRFDIDIVFEDCECPMFVPNAFSPNGDGLNDIFIVKTDCNLKDYKMRVFDRWGAMVFETNQPELGWNGGSPDYYTSPSVYNYVLEYQSENFGERIVKRGSISVIR